MLPSQTPFQTHTDTFGPCGTDDTSSTASARISTASVRIFARSSFQSFQSVGTRLPTFPLLKNDPHSMIPIQGIVHPGFDHLEIAHPENHFLAPLHRLPLGETFLNSEFAAGYSLSILVSCQLRRLHPRFAVQKRQNGRCSQRITPASGPSLRLRPDATCANLICRFLPDEAFGKKQFSVFSFQFSVFGLRAAGFGILKFLLQLLPA